MRTPWRKSRPNATFQFKPANEGVEYLYENFRLYLRILRIDL